MKVLLIVIIMTSSVLTGCNSSNNSKDPQADPRSLAETIFDAAQNGHYSSLAALIDAEADSDSKIIAQVAADKALQEEFKKHFAKGKVSGEPVIIGDNASVNILFGPDGNKEETFEMVKKNGKWYLLSF